MQIRIFSPFIMMDLVYPNTDYTSIKGLFQVMIIIKFPDLCLPKQDIVLVISEFYSIYCLFSALDIYVTRLNPD